MPQSSIILQFRCHNNLLLHGKALCGNAEGFILGRGMFGYLCTIPPHLRSPDMLALNLPCHTVGAGTLGGHQVKADGVKAVVGMRGYLPTSWFSLIALYA